VSLKSFVSLIYLILFGSLIGYTAYIWLLEKAGPPKTATYAYVNPVVAIFLGWLLADEVISFEILTGAAIILASVAMIISVKAKKG
jgi:drug/metabolite transporter (DMT)-like permease